MRGSLVSPSGSGAMSILVGTAPYPVPAAGTSRSGTGAGPARDLSSGPDLRSLLEPASPEEQERAWARFLEVYSGLILRAARRLDATYDRTMDRYAYVLDQLRADDFRRLRRFRARGSASFTAWLAVVACRLCLDQRRSQYGRTPRTARPNCLDARAARRRLVDLVGDWVESAELADAEAPDPEARLLAGERRRKLDAALAGLDDRGRLLLKLRFGHGCTAREIAELMGCPNQFCVFRELDRVLRRIRCALLEAGVEGSGL